MLQDQSENLAASIVRFCHFLRTNGISAHLRQTMTALKAARTINVSDRQCFASVLQVSLCSTVDEWELFPKLFQQFWEGPPPGPRSASAQNRATASNSTETWNEGPSVFLDQPANQSTTHDGNSRAVYGASTQQCLRKVDFSEVPYDDLSALEELSLRLLRQMSLRLSRKFAISHRTARIDLRRSIRRSIGYGGEPIVLAYKGRKPNKNRLIILLDISGSMNFYSMFLVRFAYALQAHFQHVHTFLFSTNIVEISDMLRARSLWEALRKLSQRSAGWSGGTKIGEALREFHRLYGKKLLSHDTVFIMLSDGWDTGEPELLATQMRCARRRVERILWLNPLLGLKDYQPITRGMAAALPYVDVFAPAHNLESLLALEKHL